MKLCMLEIVERTAEARRRVENDIAGVEMGLVSITIANRHQDDAMIAAVRAAMMAELNGRKAELERDLESYGVEIAA